MTGYTVHSGTTIKFSEGWDQIFQTSKALPAKKGSAKKKAVSGAAKVRAKAKARAKRVVKGRG